MTHSAKRTREIVRLRSQGKTLQAIGDKYGLTRERVRQILKEAGVTPYTEDRRPRIEAAVEYAIANPAVPLVQIANKFDIHASSIQRRLTDEEIAWRKKPKWELTDEHWCPRCERMLDWDEFYFVTDRRRPGGKKVDSYCKSCQKERHQEWLDKNRNEDRDVPENKKCRSCNKTKPSSEFWRNRANKDFMHSYCIPCGKKKNKEWHEANG